MATRLFGFFPKSEANDPDTFIAGVTAVFCEYPSELVLDLCDPYRGLPSTAKWLPSIAEIKAECERRATERQRRKARAGDRDAQTKIGVLNSGGYVDLEGPRRLGSEAWERLQMETRGRVQRRMAPFNERPTVLPYMPGQPAADPRVGLSFDELRAAGYAEHHITGAVDR